MIFITALAFFLLLSVLILIHEWGHYYAAKRSGVIVEEFGFGLPPKAKVLFVHDGTKFTINWVPFGGFVRLKGENAVDAHEHQSKGSFGSATIPARILILCAGVLMNFLLAVAILTFGFSVGRWVPTYTSLVQMQRAIDANQLEASIGIQVNSLLEGGGGIAAHVPIGSIVAKINDIPVSSVEQIAAIQSNATEVEYTLLTGENFTEEIRIPVQIIDGKAGIALSVTAFNVHTPLRNPISAFFLALRESYIMIIQTLKGIGQLFVSLASTGIVPQEISGIVGIAQLTHQSVQAGVMTYLKLVALLSLSLAALNILPFPALDGGRLVFVLAEAISRKRVNRRFELITNAVGFVFLIGLIIVITYNDIARLF